MKWLLKVWIVTKSIRQELLWKRSISEKETKYQINLQITSSQAAQTSKYRFWTKIFKLCPQTLPTIKNTNKYKTTTSCTFHPRQTRRAKMKRLYNQEINNLITKFKQNQHFKGKTPQELWETESFLEQVKLNKISTKTLPLQSQIPIPARSYKDRKVRPSTTSSGLEQRWGSRKNQTLYFQSITSEGKLNKPHFTKHMIKTK